MGTEARHRNAKANTTSVLIYAVVYPRSSVRKGKKITFQIIFPITRLSFCKIIFFSPTYKPTRRIYSAADATVGQFD